MSRYLIVSAVILVLLSAYPTAAAATDQGEQREVRQPTFVLDINWLLESVRSLLAKIGPDFHPGGDALPDEEPVGTASAEEGPVTQTETAPGA